MLLSEVFGFGVEDTSEEARAARRNKYCPFRDSPCTKSSKTDPIGVCSLSNSNEAVSLCPVRFVEGDRIFNDAAKLAFGDSANYGVFSEIRILKIAAKEEGTRDRKIGKVDFVLGRIKDGEVTDFAAVEVQAVYFSGGEIRTPMHHFIKHESLDLSNSDRRPDFRSSAQKRLFPQLQLKVPVFRRWGKKFFVVVDTQFFRELPTFTHTTRPNSEVTWLCYPIAKSGTNYSMQDVQIVYSEWDEVKNSLREGMPPEPAEIVEELQTKLDGPPSKRPRVLRVDG